MLLTTLGFLRDEPGLLDFENKMSLLRTLLCKPELDLATRTALEDVARVSQPETVEVGNRSLSMLLEGRLFGAYVLLSVEEKHKGRENNQQHPVALICWAFYYRGY